MRIEILLLLRVKTGADVDAAHLVVDVQWDLLVRADLDVGNGVGLVGLDGGDVGGWRAGVECGVGGGGGVGARVEGERGCAEGALEVHCCWLCRCRVVGGVDLVGLGCSGSV